MRQYDTEAGDIFLSCMLNDPAGIALFARQLDVDDFPLRQGLVWKAMLQCVLEDRAIPTLHELEFKLQNTSQGLDTALEVVGNDYLTSLQNLMIEKGVRSPKKAELFCERIRQSTFRAIVSDLHSEAEEALSQKVLDFDAWWNKVYCHVTEKQRKHQQKGAQLLSDFSTELNPALDAWLSGQPYMTVTTGFRGFDSILGGGFLKRELHIIGGPPGTTKTTLALTMSKKQAEKGFKVGWSSLEMPGMMLLLRAMCMEAGVDWAVLRNGGYKNDRLKTERDLKNAAAKLAKLSIFVDETAGVTTDNVHWQALQLSMTHGIDIWYVDFAQLLTDMADGPTEKAAKIFNRSKDIAKLLDIPIVILSQITKRAEYSDTKLPAAHDIPHKGHDVAGFIILTWDLYKFWSLGQITTGVVPGIMTSSGEQINCTKEDTIYYVLAKSRYGKEGIIGMKYDRSTGRISDPGLAVSPEPEPLNMEAF